MLGFDALGRFATAQISSSVVLTATVGAFSETGIAATFKVTELASTGSYTETGVAAAFKIIMGSAATSYALSGVPVVYVTALNGAVGSYNVTGISASYFRDFVNWVREPAPSSVWSREDLATRVFDPHVFDRDPIYDTGVVPGIWDDRQVPVTVWNAS